jgi:ATP-binding cassette subfamily B protein/subfamily B ATP-binding cassette protein MsbA
MSKFQRLIRYVWRQWPWLVAIFALTSLSSVAGALQPWPMKLLVDYALEGSEVPARVRDLIESSGLRVTPMVLVSVAAVASIGLFGINSLLSVALGLSWSQGGLRMVYALAGDLFRHLQRLSLLFHSRRHVGDSLSRLSEDTWCVYSLTDNLVLAPIQHVGSLVLLAVVGFSLDPVLGGLALGVAPFLALSSRFFGHRLKHRSKQGREAKARLVSFVHQTLGAIPIVQVFGTERRNVDRFQVLANRSVQESQRANLTSSSFGLVNGLITAAGLAIVLYAGGLRVLSGAIPLGTLLVFLAYVRQMQSASGGLFQVFSRLKTAEASVERLLEVIDSEEWVREQPVPRPLPVLPRSQQGRLSFEGVTFGYETARPVLAGIDLEIRPGERLALVGPSGAGKSTLVSLIPRFYDPWMGRVTLDGIDLRQVSLAELRSRISIVLQEPFLMPLTVAENIAYGRPGASRDDIIAAAAAASAEDFIQRLPDGFDTILGERAADLSGGERQRLAIARALLKDAPILILDEPTSALDVETESQLLAALQRLMVGRTTVIIAHRLSTIRHADRIVVLENGRIVEVGTHDQLVAREGSYRRYYERQFAGSDDKVLV